MVRMRRWPLAAAAAALSTWIAASSVLAADSAVTIAGFAFDPATVTVQVGDSVTWTNQDSAAHTATAGDGSFDTGPIANGGSETVTFDTAGTFAFACSIHPPMTGSVVVEAAGTTARSSGGGAAITPSPTDTEPGVSDAGTYSAGAWALAVLGVVMLVGTLVADRRFRARN
jgi:plastocyanin